MKHDKTTVMLLEVVASALDYMSVVPIHTHTHVSMLQRHNHVLGLSAALQLCRYEGINAGAGHKSLA